MGTESEVWPFPSQEASSRIAKPQEIVFKVPGLPASVILRERQQLLQQQQSGHGQPTTPKRKVHYIFSPQLARITSTWPSNPNRSAYVHSLINAYQLPRIMSLVSPTPASETDLAKYHTKEYIHALLHWEEQNEEELEEFGLGYDCRPWKGLEDYVKWIAGGSLCAARTLVERCQKNRDNSNERRCEVAVFWDGGRHHAQRDAASGFCYVNDIVLSILYLQGYFKRILYIDVDIHHGDGVEQPFLFSRNVFTLSFHLYSPGFFPCSGSPADTGMGKGKGFNLNVPLREGVTDYDFESSFRRRVTTAYESFKPDCVLMQCGCDGVKGNLNDSRDPGARGKGWRLTPKGFSKCVDLVTELCDAAGSTDENGPVPLLLLGGGGYTNTTTARTWAYCTAAALGVSIPDEIPEHELWAHYEVDGW
ncbi:hypothetical protein BC832DRAFT_535585 [Gaertneriomyces semiglobifer]|nr:hypothetical protein BC832DRAFT_535585 [Gaertneriomyces semiglobifer]